MRTVTTLTHDEYNLIKDNHFRLVFSKKEELEECVRFYDIIIFSPSRADKILVDKVCKIVEDNTVELQIERIKNV